MHGATLMTSCVDVVALVIDACGAQVGWANLLEFLFQTAHWDLRCPLDVEAHVPANRGKVLNFAGLLTLPWCVLVDMDIHYSALSEKASTVATLLEHLHMNTRTHARTHARTHNDPSTGCMPCSDVCRCGGFDGRWWSLSFRG